MEQSCSTPSLSLSTSYSAWSFKHTMGTHLVTFLDKENAVFLENNSWRVALDCRAGFFRPIKCKNSWSSFAWARGRASPTDANRKGGPSAAIIVVAAVPVSMWDSNEGLQGIFPDLGQQQPQWKLGRGTWWSTPWDEKAKERCHVWGWVRMASAYLGEVASFNSEKIYLEEQ